MSYCHPCRRHYREPEDEQGDHECPQCGLLPHERGKQPEECETCDGTGRVTVKNEVVIGWCGKQTETATEQIVDECPECNGTGEAKC